MTTRAKRSPSEIIVSPVTEWTDFHGINAMFGLKRSTAYHLDRQGLIQSVSLRHKNEKRGKRLFNVASIRSYLNSKLEAQSAVATKNEDSLRA